MTTGAGFCPAGFAPYGSGTPDAAPIPGGSLLRDTLTGLTLSSRKIDPATGDFVMDAFGRIEGMTAGQQAMYIAFKGENVFAGVDVIGPNFDREIRSRVSTAVQRAVAQGLISNVRTEIGHTGSRAFTLIRFFDETTKTEQTHSL